MKTNKLVALGLVSLTVLSIGSAAKAANVDLPAKSTGKVELKNNWEGGGVVDPEEEKPETIHPEIKPEIAGDKDLALMYYPDFDFGYHEYDESKVNTYQASVIKATKEGVATPTEFVPFVQIRSTVANWELKASATEFKTTDGKELTGARITLSNMTAVNNTKNGENGALTGTSVNALPAEHTYKLDLTTGTNTIATLTGADTTKVSKNSINFGSEISLEKGTAKGKDKDGNEIVIDRNVTNGVQLEVPAGLNVADTDEKYEATITWALTNTPK